MTGLTLFELLHDVEVVVVLIEVEKVLTEVVIVGYSSNISGKYSDQI